MGSAKIKKEIKQYITRLKIAVHPEKVLLFGSFARGEATKWSDIDLMVVADFKDLDGDKRHGFLYDLHSGLVKDHDIHVFGLTPSEFDSAKPWSIIADIKKEGVMVFDAEK